MNHEIMTENSFRLYSRHAAGRDNIERFISIVFKKFYGAELDFFHQYLLTVQSERIEGVIGFSSCENHLFLEQYLDSPIEDAIYKLSMIRPKRENIAEVGNLAAVKPGCGANLIIAMTECLLLYGFKYATFTGTKQIFSLFSKLGYTPMVLAKAKISKVKNQDAWGKYYDYSPRVAVVDLQILKQRIAKNDKFKCDGLISEARRSIVQSSLEY